MKFLFGLSCLFLGTFANPLVPKPDPVLDEGVENSDYLPSVVAGRRRLGDEDAVNDTSPSVYVDDTGSVLADSPPHLYYSGEQHQGYNPYGPQHGPFPFYPGVHTYGWPQSPVFQNWNPQVPPSYGPPTMHPWAGERPGAGGGLPPPQPRPVHPGVPQPVPGQVPRYNPLPPTHPPVGSPGGPPEIEEEAEVFPGKCLFDQSS